MVPMHPTVNSHCRANLVKMRKGIDREVWSLSEGNQSFLRHLVGATISLVDVGDEGIGFQFDNGANLLIFERHLLSINPTFEPAYLAGISVANIEETKAALILKLESGVRLIVDLSFEFQNGPETMMLTLADKTIVVWN